MHKIFAFLIFGVLFLVFGYGATQVRISDDVASAMLANDGRSYDAYIDYLESFPSDAIAIIAVTDAACSARGWEILVNLTDSLESMPLTYKVSSIASRNSKIVTTKRDEISYDDVREITFASPQERCRKAFEYKPFRDSLISDDGTVALLVVPKKSVSPNAFANEIKNAIAPYKDQLDEIDASILLSGDPIMSTEIAETMSQDFVYVALLLLTMMLVTTLVTKSIYVCLAVLTVALFSLVTSFGFMGLSGLSITPGSALAVFILVPLSTAFVIHAYGYHTRDPKSLIPEDSISPLVIAGMTTATLFALTALTPSPDVQSLAVVGSIGIVFATLALFLFAYPLFALSKKPPYLPPLVVPRWIYLRPSLGYTALVLLLAICGFGLSKINFEYNAINYLDKSHPARQAYEKVGEHFGRMTIPLVINVEDSSDPDTWNALRSATDEIRAQYNQRLQISWLYDPIQEITHALSDGEMAFPNDKASFDQIYLFFSPEDTESFVAGEGDQIVLILNVPFDSSTEYYKLKNIVSKELASANLDGRLVGRVSGFFETGHRVGLDNLVSLGVGAAIITILLMVLFRSINIALALLLVNALPALTSIAILSTMTVPIDLGSSIVTAMAFGIIVDDSTHLVVRIKQLQRRGYDPLTAVNQALSDLSGAIIITSVTLSIGFCVLFFAELVPFHDFATTILIALSTALIADLVILPTLVRSLVKDPLTR